MDDILHETDHQPSVLLILLDLEKAFDTMYRSVLLSKLKYHCFSRTTTRKRGLSHI